MTTGTLDLDEHLGAQRLEFAADRVVWAAMALIALAALLGFFGGGPLGMATVTDPSGVRLAYDRFGRKGADSVLTFEVPPQAFVRGAGQVWLSRDYLEGMKIDNITPEPDRVSRRGDGLLYYFSAPGDSGVPLVVAFDLTGDVFGSHRGRFSSRSPIRTTSFGQFFFP
jgi:hypothetical protein